VDSAAYVTRTYSRLPKVATKHSQIATHPGYAVMTRRMTDCNLYHMIGTVLKQPRLEGTGPGFTSPGERILTFLPWRRCIVTKSKLPKVNTKSKSLYGHLSVSSPRFSKIEPYVMYYTRNGSNTSYDVPTIKKDG
jgi:hypothetical protein